MKCLVRDFDDEGRMFFCELSPGHDGGHVRKTKTGYRRVYVITGGKKTTLAALTRSSEE